MRRPRHRSKLDAGVATVRVVAGLVVALGALGVLLDDRGLAGAVQPVVPSYAQVRAAHRPSDVALLDRHGEVLHEQRVDPARRRLEWTSLDAISPALVRAVLAAEDRRFLRHGGVDLLALAGSLRDLLLGRARRGGSTVSMQLAALLEPARATSSSRRGLADKVRQMRRAWALERSWTKREILEAYLNLVAFRGEIAGVAAATHLLLDKAPHAVTAAEAVALAALVRAPNATREALDRRGRALAGELAPGPEPHEVDAAIARVLDPARPHAPRVALAPHVAARLLAGAKDGAAVRSTLDAGVQRAAIEALDRSLRGLSGRNVRDGAVLVVDNPSGAVLAWVGGSGALSSARHVDGVLAHRQAGSTLKPFLYALALEERRLTAASPLDDAPIALPVAGGIYRPHNYDEDYRGLVSMRTALAASLNVPAVRTLELVGADDLAARLRALGFAGIDRRGDHYGPALALGAAEVSLAELVNAFRALANGGVLRSLRLTPEAAAGDARQVIAPAAAFVVADVLADRESRSTTFGLENPLATRFWSAVKTGTSKDMRDNWCVGFSSRYTVGVWVGNSSGEPMHDVSGVSGAAPAWLEILSFLHRDLAAERPAPPAGLVRHRVAFERSVEPAREEWFLAGTEPTSPSGAIGLALARPRIGAPVDDAVYAIDPDIPRRNQRIALAASGVASGLRWQLDGRDLGAAEHALLWPPEPGRHRLALLEAGGGAIDEVAFEVRPVARPLPVPPSSHRRPRSPDR